MLLAGLCLGLALVLTRLDVPGLPITPVDTALHDWRIAAVAPPARETRVVIVAVDEPSLREIGAWPWPRETLAELIERLRGDYDVAAVGLDVLLPEPGREPGGDARLARAVADPGVLLAQALSFAADPPGGAGRPAQGVRVEGARLADLPRASGFVGNTQALAEASRAGHITPIVDGDGAIRRFAPLVCLSEGCYDILGLTVLRAFLGAEHLELQRGAGVWDAAYRLHLGGEATGISVPLDRSLETRLPYRQDSEGFLYVSAADVLARRVPARVLANRPVLVGATAVGLADSVPTPREGLAPGVAVHAQVLTAALDGAFPVRPRAAGVLLLFVDLLLAAAAVGLYVRRSALAGPAGLILMAGLWLVVNLIAWHRAGLDLPPAEPVVLAALLLVALTPLRLLGAERQWRRLYRQFSRYLPPPVIRELVRSGADPADLEAQRREITVMFADMRGFTPVAERRSPEALAALMQRVFSEFTAVIHRHRGTVDKYMGDSVMAFWGAPLADTDHRAHAYTAARDLLVTAERLSDELREEGEGVSIRLGIGLHTGPATVGNLGSTMRRTYTALGDTVNVAARLQALSNRRGEPLLLSAQTREGLGEAPELRCLGPEAIRGRSAAVVLYGLGEGV